MPVCGGVAPFAAAWACAHRFLAAWLALQLFVKARHMKLVMTWMLSAEPWLYEAVVHERQ